MDITFIHTYIDSYAFPGTARNGYISPVLDRRGIVGSMAFVYHFAHTKERMMRVLHSGKLDTRCVDYFDNLPHQLWLGEYRY